MKEGAPARSWSDTKGLDSKGKGSHWGHFSREALGSGFPKPEVFLPGINPEES